MITRPARSAPCVPARSAQRVLPDRPWAQTLCIRLLRQSVLMLLCLVGCTSTRSDIRSFDERYFGVLQNACYPQARNIFIDVWNGRFTLPLPFNRRMTGTVSADGDLSGSGTWEESGEVVEGMIEGRILSPWFGNALLAEVTYGDCEFRLNLAPRVRRVVKERLPRSTAHMRRFGW